MDQTETSPSPLDWFSQREDVRRSRFTRIWEHSVPEVFRDVPTYYRLGNIVASFGIWELWVWQFVRSIRLAPGDRVLDVAAGTNDVGIRLLKKEPGIRVTAVDRSSDMQREGQRRARRSHVHIDSVIHDVHALPFEDGAFDVVTLQAASRHLQLDKVFPEIYRVLKPGGTFYHCDMLKPTHRVVERVYLGFLRLSVAWTASVFGASEASRNCGSYFSDAIHHFYTPEELSAVLGLCGFTDVRCAKSVWGGMVGFHAARKPMSATATAHTLLPASQPVAHDRARAGQDML